MTVGNEWWRPMPQGASTDAIRILAARGVRAFGDGFVALLLPIYLLELGFSALAIGAIVSSTLVGTALLTFWVGIIANRYSLRRLLLAAALLMAATGVGFTLTTAFLAASRHRLCRYDEPDLGRCQHLSPLEQTALTQTVEPRRRTALFARYSLIGSAAGALGVLAAAGTRSRGEAGPDARAPPQRSLMFGFYAVIGTSRCCSTGRSRRPSRRPSRLPRRRCSGRAGWSIGWRRYLAWICLAPAFWFSRCWHCGFTRLSRSR